jgi:hypothetical protein
VDDDGRRSEAVRERDFTIGRAAHAIPRVVWQPLRATGAQPLVLMGHGGSGHKRSPQLKRMAELFTGYGWWAAAIDAPVHGARGPGTDAPAPASYRQCGRARPWFRTGPTMDPRHSNRAQLFCIAI